MAAKPTSPSWSLSRKKRNALQHSLTGNLSQKRPTISMLMPSKQSKLVKLMHKEDKKADFVPIRAHNCKCGRNFRNEGSLRNHLRFCTVKTPFPSIQKYSS